MESCKFDFKECLKRMRPKSQSKYEAIISTTIELVKELGFTGISVAKIAKKAEISPATIYIHFKNREDLFIKIYKMIRSVGFLQDENFHRTLNVIRKFTRTKSMGVMIKTAIASKMIQYNPLICFKIQNSASHNIIYESNC